LSNDLDQLLIDCESKEKELMEQFGETNASEFNYDICCAIFRQLIEQIEKETKVMFGYKTNEWIFSYFS
jgi:hypothetical protein